MTKDEMRMICQKNFKDAKRVHDTVTNIFDSKIIATDNIIAIYFPLRNEVDILELMSLYSMKVFCFPRVENDVLEFYIVENVDALVKGPFNTLQPHKNKNNKVNLEEIDAFIIPCVGVNSKMYRLGRGRGFYDRTLKGKDCKKIGVCYAENIGVDFPEEVHDIKLDYLFKR